MQIASSLDRKCASYDAKVNKLMKKGYAHSVKPTTNPVTGPLYGAARPITIPTFTYWAQNCWGIKTLVDMECMLAYHHYDEHDKRKFW